MDPSSQLIDAAFWITCAAILALLVLSSFFSGSETALTAASRGKLKSQAEKGSRVPHAQGSRPDGLLDRVGELEKAEVVRDRRSPETHPLGDGFLRQLQPIHHLPEPTRPFDRVEVLALEVLDEGELEHVVVGDLRPDDGRNGPQSGFAGRAPASLPRDELVAVFDLPNDHRLEDAVVQDALPELIDCRRPEVHAGLVRVGSDRVEFDLTGVLRPAGVRKKRSEATPKSSFHVS